MLTELHRSCLHS